MSMSLNIDRDSKFIKVMAADARHERLDSGVRDEMNSIVAEMKNQDNAAKLIAQTVAFTVDQLQVHELDSLNQFADVKNIAYGEKAVFNVRTGHVKAYMQAFGATPARSMVGSRQISVETKSIAARPAIPLLDALTGRVNMADLVREANTLITNKKMYEVETVLHNSMATYASPFYATSAGGINQTLLDQMLAYWRRLGPVTIVGDMQAVAQLANLTGMALSSTQTQRTEGMIEEFNNNGFIGKYKGTDVVVMNNAYEPGSTVPMLNPNWLYIIPGGVSTDQRNLKIVNEGGILTFTSQNIDDLIQETRLETKFGVAWVMMEEPNMGAFFIN